MRANLRNLWAIPGFLLTVGGLFGCEGSATPADEATADAALPDGQVPAETDAEPPIERTCAPSAALTGDCQETWDAVPVYVIAEMNFAQIEDGTVSLGFDLDNSVSQSADPASCNQRDFVDPAGNPGIDNQLGVLWPTIVQLTGDAIDGLIQGAINEGKLLITLAVDDHDLDGSTRLGVRKTAGAPILDTSATLLAWQTFSLDATADPSLAEGGWITEGPHAGSYEAGPVDVALPVLILDFDLVLVVRDARFRLTPRPDGSMDGVLSGGLPINDFMDEIDRAAVPANLRALVRNLLNTRADLYPDGDGACQSLSTVLYFRAVPAFVRP